MSARRNRQTQGGANDNRRGTSSYDLAQRSRSKGRPSVQRRWPLPGLLMFLFAVVALRLMWLQVIDSTSLQNKAKSQHLTTVDILAKRGTIYDRNGNVLATSVECQTIYCNPEAVEDKEGAAKILADKLGGSASDYKDILNQQTTFAYIQKRVDDDIANPLFEALSDSSIEGIYSLEDVKRVYPYGSVAGQILGFVGDDGDGLSGLELYYNDVLKGENGEMIMERGATGVPVAGGASEIHSAKDGTDIVISLDVNIQQNVEEAIVQGVADYAAESGNAMVTDPATGEILAACSLPLFDPTDTSTITDSSLNLSCVSASYEPGSTFKVLTVAIGYDSGAITPSSTYTVPPSVQVGDDWVTDADARDYTMDMTPSEVIKRSSNTGAALIGMTIGSTTFSEGIARFGIGSSSGIDFPGESQGLVPKLEEYTGATLGSMSFGQGLSVPSVQIVKAVGAIAHKGLMSTPHFLVQEGGVAAEWPEATQVVSEEAANQVISDMRLVVNDEGGTGTKAYISGYDIAGKTGTGEQASEEGGYQSNSFMSSFIGFANADDADVLVYVGLYGTAQHGSTAAAPIFKTIMSNALSVLGVQPTS